MIFCIIPLNEARTDSKNDSTERDFAGYNEQVDMRVHDAICNQTEIAFGLVIMKDIEEFPEILVIFKDPLTACGAQDDMIDVITAGMSKNRRHRDSPFL